MTAEKLKKWLNDSLPQISHSAFKGCIKVKDVEVQEVADQAVVIMSEIGRVRVTLEKESGETSNLTAFAKIETSNEGFNKLADECNLFDNEILMYGKLLKAMESLMLEYGDTEEYLWPECFHCSDRKFLLQDLCEMGYLAVPQQNTLDMAHMRLALRGLGKFHAMALVLKERGVFDLSDITSNVLSRNLPFVDNLYTGSLVQLARIIEKDWGHEWAGVPEKLRCLQNGVGEYLAYLVNSTQGMCDVLCHGDFSIRNMLFQYSSNSQLPVRVKFIDFQTGSFSNVGFDLIPILYSSMMPQVREENMETLLSIYTSSIRNTCINFKYTGRIPSLDDVKQSLKVLSRFGMFVSLFAIPLFLTVGGVDGANDLDLDGLVDESKDKHFESTFKDDFYKIKIVEDALKFELKRCLKENIL